MRHKKKSRLAAVELIVILTATAALFIGARGYALSARGYSAVGGELMLLLIPIIYYELKRILRDFAADVADLLRHAPED